MSEDDALNLTTGKSGVLIPVRVTPRGRKNAITGARNGVLLISVTAPPVDGAANAAVIEVLRDTLRCAKSALSLSRGEKSRDKVIAVSGLDFDVVKTRLEADYKIPSPQRSDSGKG